MGQHARPRRREARQEPGRAALRRRRVLLGDQIGRRAFLRRGSSDVRRADGTACVSGRSLPFGAVLHEVQDREDERKGEQVRPGDGSDDVDLDPVRAKRGNERAGRRVDEPRRREGKNAAAEDEATDLPQPESAVDDQ